MNNYFYLSGKLSKENTHNDASDDTASSMVFCRFLLKKEPGVGEARSLALLPGLLVADVSRGLSTVDLLAGWAGSVQ